MAHNKDTSNTMEQSAYQMHTAQECNHLGLDKDPIVLYALMVALYP